MHSKLSNGAGLTTLALLSLASSSFSQSLDTATLATEGGDLRDLLAGDVARAEDTGTVTLRVTYPFGALPIGVPQDLDFAWRVGQGDDIGLDHDVNLLFEEDLWYAGADDGTISILSNATFLQDGEALITLPLGLGSAIGDGGELYPRFIAGSNELELSLGWTSVFHLGDDGTPAGTLANYVLPVVCVDDLLMVLPNGGRSKLYLDESGDDQLVVSYGGAAAGTLSITLDVVPAGAVTLVPSVISMSPGDIVEVDITGLTLGEFAINANDGSGGSWRGPTMQVSMPLDFGFSGFAGMVVPGGEPQQEPGKHRFSKCTPAAAGQPGPGGGMQICMGYCQWECEAPSCEGEGESEPGTIVRDGKCHGLDFDACYIRDDQIVFSHPWLFEDSYCTSLGCPYRTVPGGNVKRFQEKPCCYYKVDAGAPPISVNVNDCYE